MWSARTCSGVWPGEVEPGEEQGMRAVSGHQGSEIACKPAPEGTMHRPKEGFASSIWEMWDNRRET